MKKLALLIAVITLLLAGFFLMRKPVEETSNPSVSRSSVQSESAQKESVKEQYLFVPYWTIDEDVSSAPYETLLYFGVTASENGIATTDEGYRRLSGFKKVSLGKNTFLVIRMLTPDVNQKILESKPAQKRIIGDAITIAQEHNFSGIVLDFEMQGLPFESLINNITSLNQLFAQSSREKGLSFGTLVYGDVFFRIRPYNIKAISKDVDRMYIMAYDFSKARSNPGPNFPLQGVSTYGYDFKRMVSDFLKLVPPDKLTIIFGMYGYDWSIDEEGRGKELATAKTTLELTKFMTQCVSQNSCRVTQDNDSAETKITYREDDDNRVIWFENQSSVEKKIEYLSSKNLHSVGFWAYSYF